MLQVLFVDWAVYAAIVLLYLFSMSSSLYAVFVKQSTYASLFLWGWAVLLCLATMVFFGYDHAYFSALFFLSLLGCLFFIYKNAFEVAAPSQTQIPTAEKNTEAVQESVIPSIAPISQNVLRSLHRVMGDNRRIMALHDNWVYGKREHPYIMFKNLDGSKLRLRASLSDISNLFPETLFVSRNEIINRAVGVHEINDSQIILHVKTGRITIDVSPNYLENLSNPLPIRSSINLNY